MNDSQRLLFVHIPKSAGMSLFRAIQRIYTKEKTLRYADSTIDNRNKYLSMNHEEVRRYDFITGHLPLPLFLNKPISDYKIITVVRDPVDRELSAYYYMKTWAQHPRHQEVKKWDLYQYLDHYEKSGWRNYQCWHLCEKQSYEYAKEVVDKHLYLAAPLEYLNEFCIVLQHRLELPEIKLLRENTTSFRFTQQEIHPDIIERFRVLTEGDIQLYEMIKTRFEQTVINEFNEIIGKLPPRDNGVLANSE